MEGVFLKIFNMAVSAGYLVVAVLLARLLLRRAPRWVHCVLWGLVGLRLILPVSLESVLSLIPSKEVVSPTIVTSPAPQIQTGMPVVDGSLNPVIGQTFTPAPAAPVNPMQIAVLVAAWVWLAGMAVLLLVATVSYWRLRRRVAEATPLKDNIFQCQSLPTTFILGIFKPRIYISYNISEAHLPLVLAHEQAHLRRRDHWIKPLAYLLLSVYWFHPLVWIGYILLCRDIELACDERVMRALGSDTRRAYAEALLYNGVHSRRIAACPLAFGEVGIKERVKSVMHYKKPAFWIVLVAVVACIVVAVCFLTSPKTTPTITGYGTTHKDITIRVTELELEGDDPHITVRWKNESDETLTLAGVVTMGYEDATPKNEFPPKTVFQGEKVEPGDSLTKTYSLEPYAFLEPGSYRLEMPYQKGLWDIGYTVGWVTFTVPEELAERLVAASLQEWDLYPNIKGVAFTPITDEAFLEKHGYHVYYYGFDAVKVKQDGELVDLKAALKDGEVTVDDLLADAAARAKAGEIVQYTEGDSVMYAFDNYTIIKQHTSDGRRHCFVGRHGLTFERLESFFPGSLRVYDYTLSVTPGEERTLRRLTDEGYRAAHGFDVYAYGLDHIQIETSEGMRDLLPLLRNGTVTAEQILDDANTQWRNHQIGRDATTEGPLYYLYKFGSYVLLHHVPEKGQGDLYIGTTDMDFSVLGDLAFREPRITSLALAVQASENRVLRKLTDDTFLTTYGFDVYTYGLDSVQVQTDQGMRDLKELLQNGSVTAEMLVNDARRRTGQPPYTGGDEEFRFDTYAILQAHQNQGDNSLYIGVPDMHYSYLTDTFPDMRPDLDGDGMPETTLLRHLNGNSFDGTPVLDILTKGGALLWRESFYTKHALFVCTTDEGNYLLHYYPDIGTGVAGWSYTLSRLSGGQAEVVAQREIEFDLSGRQPFDVPEMVSFAEEVGALLENSYLLVSNSGEVLGNASGPYPGSMVKIYRFLDTVDIYAEGDDLATRLKKYSDYLTATEGTSGETTTAPTTTTTTKSTTTTATTTKEPTTTMEPTTEPTMRPDGLFDMRNVTRITFYAYFGKGIGSDVPAENMAEIKNWLATFTVGEKAPFPTPPGTDTCHVEIEYADGTIIKNSLDTVTIDGEKYYTQSDEEPECLLEIQLRARPS